MMTDERTSPYRDPRTWGWVGLEAAILAAIAWIGLGAGPEQRFRAWLLVLALMTAFAVVAGRAITGKWRGVLIDGRYKMSLSKLQMLAWTLVILSTLLMAALTNLALGAESPLDIEIPSALWVVMGISSASLVGSPAILSRRRDKKADPDEKDKTVEALEAQGYTEVDGGSPSVIVRNTNFDGARWGDLLKGEEVGNAPTVDVGKLQMFFFTFILILAYSSEIGRLFGAADVITSLPQTSDGTNTLLGISHTGYLANKTVSHSKEITA